jgi:hypothetical protein
MLKNKAWLRLMSELEEMSIVEGRAMAILLAFWMGLIIFSILFCFLGYCHSRKLCRFHFNTAILNINV